MSTTQPPPLWLLCQTPSIIQGGCYNLLSTTTFSSCRSSSPHPHRRRNPRLVGFTTTQLTNSNGDDDGGRTSEVEAGARYARHRTKTRGICLLIAKLIFSVSFRDPPSFLPFGGGWWMASRRLWPSPFQWLTPCTSDANAQSDKLNYLGQQRRKEVWTPGGRELRKCLIINRSTLILSFFCASRTECYQPAGQPLTHSLTAKTAVRQCKD